LAHELKTVLVTRPERDAERTAAELARRGYRSVPSAVLIETRIETALPPLERFGALAFTSPRGVAAFARLTQDRSLPVFGVGGRTAEAARASGFSAVTDADGDGAALARLISARYDKARGALLLPQGRETAFDLAAALAPSGIAVEALALYAMEAARALPAEAHAALTSEQTCAILLMSPRTAKAALHLACADPASRSGWQRALKVALSPAIAAALGPDPGPLAVAAHPDEKGLFAALEAAFPPR